jgi:hypothetical protein
VHELRHGAEGQKNPFCDFLIFQINFALFNPVTDNYALKNYNNIDSNTFFAESL